MILMINITFSEFLTVLLLASFLAATMVAWFRPHRHMLIAGFQILSMALLLWGIAILIVEIDGWSGSFFSTIWLIIAAAVIFQLITALIEKRVLYLTILLNPYLILLALFAILITSGKLPFAGPSAFSNWLIFHIVLSLATFGLATVSAFSSLSVLMQTSALKRKEQGALSRRLPDVNCSEKLEIRTLLAAEILLGVGAVTGIAASVVTGGPAVSFDHKTVLSLIVFLVVGVLLIGYFWAGWRGKITARIILCVFLLLTLAYPGTKLVTEIVLN